MGCMDLHQALRYYLDEPTGDLQADLVAAVQEAARWRKEGPQATTTILRAMREQLGMTYEQIESASYNPTADAKISKSTAERLVNAKTT